MSSHNLTRWQKWWVWYDKHVLHTTMLAVAIAFGATIPHIVWLDYMALTGTTIFEHNTGLDAFMVAVEHIEIIPLAKIIFDAIRIVYKKCHT